MSFMVKSHLTAGYIYGDNINKEYIFMPGSEIGVENPLCVLEQKDQRTDTTLAEAVKLVNKLSLKQVRHPIWGEKTC